MPRPADRPLWSAARMPGCNWDESCSLTFSHVSSASLLLIFTSLQRHADHWHQFATMKLSCGKIILTRVNQEARHCPCRKWRQVQLQWSCRSKPVTSQTLITWQASVTSQTGDYKVTRTCEHGITKMLIISRIAWCHWLLNGDDAMAVKVTSY